MTAIKEVFKDSIQPSGVSRSRSFFVGHTRYKADFCVQLIMLGDGILTLETEGSMDDLNFAKNPNERAIITNFTSTSGPNNDGKILVNFSPTYSDFIRFVLIEKSGIDSIVGTALIGVI